jgi:hypothetical protein
MMSKLVKVVMNGEKIDMLVLGCGAINADGVLWNWAQQNGY